MKKKLTSPYSTTIDKFFAAKPDNRKLFNQEKLILDVSEEACEILDTEGVSRETLASRLGMTEEAVTAILNGKNLTLRRVADIFTALGYTLEVKAIDPK
jgi:hypothetical protein